MPPSYKTYDHIDSVPILLQKAHAIQTVNGESLAFIQSRKGLQVVARHEYTLQTKTSQKTKQKLQVQAQHNVDIDIHANLFEIIDHKSTKNVDDIVTSWMYDGEALTREILAVDHFIDLRLKKFDDLIRLQNEYERLLDKYTPLLIDGMESRAAVECILHNVEILQVAIGQIHEQTLDVADSIMEDDDDVIQGMQDLSKCMKRLQTKIPRLQFQLNLDLNLTGQEPDYAYYVTAGNRSSIVDFFDCSSLSAKFILSTFTLTSTSRSRSRSCGYVYALEPCVINNRQYIACSYTDTTIKLWDLSTHTIAATLTGHTVTVRALASYTDVETGVQMLASGGWDKTIKLWNLNNYDNNDNDTLVQTLNGHTGYISSLQVYEKARNNFLVSGSFDGTIKIWNLQDKCLIATIDEHEWCAHALSIYYSNHNHNHGHGHGQPYLASRSHFGCIRIWNLIDFSLVTTLCHYSHGIPTLRAICHDHKTTLVSGYKNGEIKFWSLENYTCIGTIEAHSSAIQSLEAIKCDGRLSLATVSSDKCIRIWDVENLTCVSTLRINADVITMRAFIHGDQACLATGNNNGKIQLWME